MSGDESDSRTALLPWIIGLVLFVLLLYGASKAIGGNFFPWARQNLISNQTTLEGINNNFDVLLRNLEDCTQLTKDNCLCEGFPSWPSFQKGTTLNLEMRGEVTTFILNFEKKEIRNEKLTNIKLAGKLIKKGTTTNSYVLEDLASDPKIIMDWKTLPPVFSLSGDPKSSFFRRITERKAVSGFVYRSQGKMYFLTSFEPEEKVSAFIGSMIKCSS